MRKIQLQLDGDMLVLNTPEYDGYLYLQIENGKADVSNLDENTCKKTFDCTTCELKSYLKNKGY